MFPAQVEVAGGADAHSDTRTAARSTAAGALGILVSSIKCSKIDRCDDVCE
jgi:hypothetical protein